MSIAYNSSIVTNGLILCLDALNPRSYPGSGTSWFDVSGNNNTHTLSGSPTYSNGAFSFSGTQGVVRATTMTGLTSTLCTVVLWMYTSDTTTVWCRGNDNSYYLTAQNSGGAYYHGTCGTPINYVDTNLVTNPSTPTNYNNGAYHMWEAKDVNFVTTPWTQFNWFNYSSFELTGTVAAIMMYNRTITAAESAQNFAAYRGRYGI